MFYAIFYWLLVIIFEHEYFVARYAVVGVADFHRPQRGISNPSAAYLHRYAAESLGALEHHLRPQQRLPHRNLQDLPQTLRKQRVHLQHPRKLRVQQPGVPAAEGRTHSWADQIYVANYCQWIGQILNRIASISVQKRQEQQTHPWYEGELRGRPKYYQLSAEGTQHHEPSPRAQ